ncbi:MAG: ABC transporter substrate-binding protein [Chloroflexi bacterium]|nr:ABC transporter substrate-binding protein [Chloroflexota bacterium]
MRRRALPWLAIGVLAFAACGPAATPTTVPPTAAPTRVAAATATPTTLAPAGPTRGGVVRIPITSDPTSWDPVNRLNPTLMTKGNVFSFLFSLWPDPPSPGCESAFTKVLVNDWRWVDDRTAEFTIRQGVKFHNKPPVNGREVVAQDIVFTTERWRTQDWLRTKLGLVKSVEAVDKYTFRMTSSVPWGGMVLELMGHPYGMAALAQEAGGAKGELWENPEKSWIGSGPFTFEKWVPGVRWTLARNPDYWRPGRPLLDGLEFHVIPELSTQMAVFRAGRINMAHAWQDLQAGDVAKTVPGLQVLRCPSASTFPGNLFMNTEGPPFNDARVRRAVSMAIDREALVKGPHLGRATVIPLIRPGVPYALALQDVPPEVRQYIQYNPDKAKQLLAEAGYPKGFRTTFNGTTQYVQHNYRAVWEAVADMLGKVGIEVKLNFMEYGQFAASVLQAKYPVGEMGSSPNLQMTPEDSLALANPSFKYAGNANRSRVVDPEYDQLYEQFISSNDENKRAELARQLQLRQIEQAYRIVLPSAADLLVLPPEVKVTGYMAHGQEMFRVFETAWIAR